MKDVVVTVTDKSSSPSKKTLLMSTLNSLMKFPKEDKLHATKLIYDSVLSPAVEDFSKKNKNT